MGSQFGKRGGGFGERTPPGSSAPVDLLPKTRADVQTAFGFSGGAGNGGFPHDLFLYNMASGNLVGDGTGHTETPTATNEYEVDISSQFNGSNLGVRYDGANDGFSGSDSAYGDPGSPVGDDWAWVGVFHIDAIPASTRSLFHNFASGSGLRLDLQSNRTIQYNVSGQVVTTGTMAPQLHAAGAWYVVLCWYEPSTEIGVSTGKDEVTDTTGIPSAVVSTASFGMPGASTAFDSVWALAATFTGADAAALRGAQRDTFATALGIS